MLRILSSRIFTSSFLMSLFPPSEHCGDVRHQLARQLELGAATERMLAAVVVQRDRIFVGAERVLRKVRRQERDVLPCALFLRVPGEVLALGSEADAERAVFHPRDM